jgi:hypothetical protein
MCVKSPKYRFLHFLAPNRPNPAPRFTKLPRETNVKTVITSDNIEKDKIDGEWKLERGAEGVESGQLWKP